MGVPVISVEKVSVRFNNRVVLEDVSFHIDKPSVLTVLGPNGAGKTTLIRLLLGLVKPFKGSVRVLGMNPFIEGSKLRKMVGYVPQRDRVSYEIPLRVGEVVMMSKLLRKPLLKAVSSIDVESARMALSHLGMVEYWDNVFNELSGGQQRRVLIARALASDPALLLLDEVFTGLDLKSQEHLLSLLKILKENGKSIVLVEHEIYPLIDLTDTVLILNRTVCTYGDPYVVLSEENLKSLYPCARILEKEGSRLVILGDKHA
ncbi:MAG: metal ABC transporter ATP-binding protein [Thermoproteota archaeon]